MPVLASLGEILFDFLPIEEAGETVGFRLAAGGGPYNVAVGMARLGQPTAFIGRVSHDYFGQRLLAKLRAEGIDPRFVSVDPHAPTTLAFVANEGGEPSFTFYGEGAADTLITPADLPADLAEQVAILHCGGISLLRGSAPATAEAAIDQVRGHGLVSLDPNIRPKFIGEQGAAYHQLLDRLIAKADLLKVSAADLEWLRPAAPPLAAAEALLDQGPTLVALTLGGDGAVALRRTASGSVEHVHAPGFPVTVVDTVGAGDTFTAGLLSALAERGATNRAALQALPSTELAAALRMATVAAALACGRVGADPPTAAELAAVLAA